MAISTNSISIFYTQGIAGDLDLLPRLHTVLKQLRAEAPDRSYTVDLGGSCMAGIWHCDATAGRSTLIALDGLGYVAANAQSLSAESFVRMRESPAAIALVNQDHIYTEGDVLFALAPTVGDGHLCVILRPDRSTSVENDVLHVAAVTKGEIGVARVIMRRHYHLLESRVVPVPASTAPDPTIAGVVDFVIGEAEYYQKRKAHKAAQSASRRALAEHLSELLASDLDGLRGLFTRFASSPEQWEAAKQLGFLLSRAAHEDADMLKITPEVITLHKGPTLIASARPQGSDTAVVLEGMLTHDPVLSRHTQITVNGDDILLLRIGDF